MDRYKKQRMRMVETQLKARDITDVRVLKPWVLFRVIFLLMKA